MVKNDPADVIIDIIKVAAAVIIGYIIIKGLLSTI